MGSKKEEIGKRIKMIRKDLNLSQREFAEKINMKTQYLSNVENGLSGLTIEKVIQICELANISADYLIFGTSNLPIHDFKKSFSMYSDKEINIAFNILKDLSLFLKK